METIDVVAAIIERDGRVLATQRGYGALAGGWEFPGGKIEPGETPGEALAREIREELEVAISIDRLVCEIDYDYDGFRLHMRCFLCRITQGELKLVEHSDAKWLDAPSLGSVAWLPADTAVIQAIRDQGIV